MIVITGASGGIGQAVLKNLLKIDKVICLYRDESKINPRPSHPNLSFYKLNLENENEIVKFVNSISFKKICIINLAAVYIDKLIVNMSVDELDKHYKVNFRSIYILVKELLPRMLNTGGNIILFSSPAVNKGHQGSSAYSSTKSSLEVYSKVINNEYSKFGIKSSLIVLGYYNCGIYKKLSKKVQKKLLQETSNDKFSSFNEITDIIKIILESKAPEQLYRLDTNIKYEKN